MKGSELFLAPHNDDETLFGAFLIMRHEPEVIICLRSYVQFERFGIQHETREQESFEAAAWLRPQSLTQWRHPDSKPDWDFVKSDMELIAFQRPPSHVFAPALEDDGHEQHNRIGALALEVFGPDRVTSYLTYTRSSGRSRNGTEVVPEPDWIVRKHRALACYRSQIEEPSCREHFLRDIREYVQ